MKVKLFDHLALGSITASAILTAALYSRLPERIPTHFDIHGVPDGFSPRSYGAWLLPGIAYLVWLSIRAGVLVPPAMRARMEAPAARITVGLVVLLLVAIQGIVLWSSLNDNAPVGRPFGVLLATFSIATGLLMPRLRRNPWVGFRLPWTMRSDEVWARTHRFAGASMVVSGVVALLLVVLGHPGGALAAIIAAMLVATIYSCVIAREVPPET